MIHAEGFALPITAVQQVVPLDRIYGDPQRSGLSLTRYRDQEILVVDIGHRIFGNAPSLATSGAIATPQFLLVVQNSLGDAVGIPLDSPPIVRRLADSSFTPIPQAYLATGNLRCLSSQRVTTEANESFFVLDVESLVKSEMGV